MSILKCAALSYISRCFFIAQLIVTIEVSHFYPSC